MPFRIVVVGSGIAGLVASIALATKGHQVTVLEATSELRPIGGIIVLQANANRCLDRLGIYDSLLRYCSEIPNGPCTRRYEDGSFLAQKSVGAHMETYGYPLWPIHRADVQYVLLAIAKQRGVVLRLGCPIDYVDEGSCAPAVVCQDGQRIKADLVVGADGIDSVVRKNIEADFCCVRDSGMDVTRATIPARIIDSDPELSALMDENALWCGPGTTIASMAVRKGHERLLGLDCCHQRINSCAESQSKKQNVAEFKTIYENFSPTIKKVLSHVKEAHVWKLNEAAPRSWIGRSGRVVLIGDAAHASLPWVGQGAGMAIEDAASLAEHLEEAETPRDIPRALDAFQALRKPRCDRVQTWSAMKGRRATLNDGPEQRERDDKMIAANGWVRSEPWDGVHIDEIPEIESLSWKAWLCGHDAVDFVPKAGK